MRKDPTADWAVGAVNREWKRMKELAKRIQSSSDREWAERESRRFTGIFRRLLDDPEEVISDRYEKAAS